MLTRRHFNRLAALGPLAGLAAGKPGAALQPPQAGKEVTSSSPLLQASCGALIKDNFSSGRMDTTVWDQIYSIDPGIKVGFQDGELRIWGTSAPIPDDQFRANLGVMCRYAGLYSRVFPAVDLSLASRVKMPSGICAEPGDHVAAVHLCGVLPDCYPEVLFGKFEGTVTAETMRKYYPKLFPGTTWPDARGWWFAIVGQDSGRPVYRVSGTPLAERGDERTTFYDALVEYDEPTRLARGFLKLGGRWIQLGETEMVIRGLTKVELKLRNLSPLSGTYREARFDDCRLYPNPRRNPMRVVLTGTGNNLGRQRAPFRVALYTADGTHKVSENHADHGLVCLPVVESSWVAFPVSASVRLYQGETELWRGQIEAHDVEGLYPGDLWTLNLSNVHAGE